MRIFKGLTFSWKRAIGLTGLRTKVSRKIGVPTTKYGLQRRIGDMFLSLIFPKKNRRKRY